MSGYSPLERRPSAGLNACRCDANEDLVGSGPRRIGEFLVTQGLRRPVPMKYYSLHLPTAKGNQIPLNELYF
jgi:hypothetical protein